MGGGGGRVEYFYAEWQGPGARVCFYAEAKGPGARVRLTLADTSASR